MFTSRTFAPPRTCSSATSTAPVKSPRLDQAAEARRAGDVRPLADQDEARVGADLERLEAAPARSLRAGCGERARREPSTAAAIAARVLGRRAAAAAGDVEEARRGELAEQRARHLGRLVVAAEGVRQPGVRVRADEARRELRELGDVRPHLVRAERAVDADDQRLGVLDRGPERLDRLPGERAAGEVDDRGRDPERQLGRRLARGDDRRLRVQRVEDRLEQQQVDAALDERRASARRTRPSPRRTCCVRNAGSSTFGLSESVTLSGPTEPATKRSPAASRAIRAPATFIS